MSISKVLKISRFYQLVQSTPTFQCDWILYKSKGIVIFAALKQVNRLIMSNAAIYLRVSTVDQNYERQRVELEALVKSRGDNLKYVFEEKRSAVLSMDTREQLTKMRQLTKDDVDIIYIWDITRLSRRSIDFINLVYEFANKGICLYFKDKNIITLDEDGQINAMASIYLYMLGIFAQMDAENLKAKMKSGKEKSLLDGNSYTTHAPFGYYLDNKKLYIKEDEAELIRMIYDLYIDGKTLNEAAIQMNSKNIPTKSGGKWTAEIIRKMIINPVYKGKPEYRNYKKVNGKLQVDKVRVFDAPAIVDAGKWDLAQEQRVKNITCADKSRTRKALLRGIIVCGLCGKSCNVAQTKNKVALYRCSDKRASINTKVGCKNGGITADYIDYIIWELVKNIYKQNRFTEQFEAAKQANKDKIDSNLDQISNYLDEITKINKNIAKVRKGYLNGIYDDISASKEIKEYNNQIEKINRLISDLEAENVLLERKSNISKDQFKIDDVEPSNAEKALIIREYIKEARLFTIATNKRVVEVEYNLGFTEYVLISTYKGKKGYSLVVDTESIIFNKDRCNFSIPENDHIMIDEETDIDVRLGDYSFDEMMNLVGIKELPEIDKNDKYM